LIDPFGDAVGADRINDARSDAAIEKVPEREPSL
jgi:hypothetical protein